jgi:phage terminase large subunit GpA-like protein
MSDKKQRSIPSRPGKVVRHKKTKTTTKINAFNRVADAIEPRPDLTVSQYSDQNRILPRGGSFESGPWRTDRFPFLREIMDSFTWKLKSKMRVILKGSQVGVTEILLNFMFYKVEHKPGPVLYTQKTISATDRFLRQRFEKSVAVMPSIKKLLKRKKKHGGSTRTLKSYPGGMLVFGGANSAASLRSMPIEDYLVDEEDSYELDIGEEGSPVDLGVVRTRNFPYGHIIRASTPKIKETSTIEPAFLLGDQRYYEVPCPYCGELDYLRWSRLKYENDDPTTVRLLCEKCGMFIEERYKVWMFAEENGAKWVPHNAKDGQYPSWFLPAFYSPLGFFSWEDIVKDWLEAEREFSDQKRQVVINTIFGESYSKKGKMIHPSWLEERKEEYKADVPIGGLIVAMGFDVQESRIEGEVIAWGKAEENWSIDYPVFIGDTALPQVWAELEVYITKKIFKHESGQIMYPSVIAIDSGHRAEQVYAFCRKHEARRVFPVKGDDGWGKGFIDRPLKKNKAGIFLYRAWVDELKSKVYSSLQIEEPGPGYCHFPKKQVYDKHYFSMLTAEQLITVRTGFKNKLKWELPAGKRNEALDARCYAIAALNILGPTLQAVEAGRQFVGMQSMIARKKKKRRVHSRGIQ